MTGVNNSDSTTSFSHRNIPQGLRKYMNDTPDPSAMVVKQKLSPEEQLQQQRTNFFKMIAATLKHQTPDEPADISSMAQTFGVLQQTEEIIKLSINMQKLLDVFKGSELFRAMQFQGKIVNYNTSKGEFNGQDQVSYQYQIKGNIDSKPQNSYLISNVIVYNKQGIEVYKERGGNRIGKHHFKWRGTDNYGKIQPEGEYHIKVEAYWECQEGGITTRTDIEAGGFDTGVVERVHSDGKGKAILHVNNCAITMDDIVDVVGDADKKEELKISDFSHYIGKTAIIDDKKIEVNNGFVNLSFHCDIDLPGKIKIKLFNSDGTLVGTSISDNVKKGFNVSDFKILDCYTDEEALSVYNGDVGNRKNVANGTYQYEIYVEDVLSPGADKFVKFNNKKQITITGLDFSSTTPYILCGNDKYKIHQLSGLSESIVSSSSLFAEGVNYLGKIAQVVNNTVNFDGQTSDPVSIKLPILNEPNSRYKQLSLRIFDENGTMIREIKKSPLTMFTGEDEFFDYDILYDLITQESRNTLLTELNIPIAQSNQAPATLSELRTYIDSLRAGHHEEESSEEGASQVSEEDEEEESVSQIPTLENILKHLKTQFIRGESYFSIGEGDVLKYEIKDFSRIFPHYDNLSEQEKKEIAAGIMVNSKTNIFIWDGMNNISQRVNPGIYKYEIFAVKESAASYGNKNEKVDLSTMSYLGITEYKVDDGKLYFQGKKFGYDEDSSRYFVIDNSDMFTISKDDIVKLTAI